MATQEWKQKNQEKMRAYRRLWYAKNSKHAKARVCERRKDLRLWFLSVKKTLKCERCPEDHPACLDFHHRDPEKKDVSLAMAIAAGWSKEHVMREMKKCRVLCANCHRKLHYHLGSQKPRAGR